MTVLPASHLHWLAPSEVACLLYPSFSLLACKFFVGWGLTFYLQAYYEVASSWKNIGDSMVFRIPALSAVLVRNFHDKVIPDVYLRASKEQRLRLLQGLMDSDGCISSTQGQGIYTSTERMLAESVSELLWSLGIKNTISTALSTQRVDWNKPSMECGRVATGETLFYVKFTAFSDTKICGLERKQCRTTERSPQSTCNFRYIDK